jgi:benzoylformate decarboxylase
MPIAAAKLLRPNETAMSSSAIIGPVWRAGHRGERAASIQALWTAVQHQLPLTAAVHNNAEYGAMKGFKTLFGIDHFTDAIETAVDLPGIDLVAVAQGMGVAATRPHDPATLSDILITALASPVPILIDVPVAALRGVGPV